MKAAFPWLVAAGVCCAIFCRLAPAQQPSFGRDVLPILQAHCVHCHGPDEEKSGLRLDTAGWLLAGGNRGPAAVPGRLDESLLIRVLEAAGEIPQMPADASPLPADKVGILREWIAAGAPATPDELAMPPRTVRSSHWAFQPLAHVEPPSVANEGWVRNDIDRFILARLEAQGLSPSPEAERTTLIRRLSLDLTGLLPSPEEVREFVADPRPDAYEQLVERLLASPHYGERWGRHWLDAARYADSNGYTIDSARNIWKYRDWVIDALNRDLPFDQFTIAQIAGDMLPGATIEQRIATGFHRNTLRNEEGGTDPEQFRVEAVADRVQTTGSVFLGLTLGCARCHDHKYDPISQREYYELFALLNNADEPDLAVPTDQQAKEEPILLAEIAEAEKRLKMVDDNLGTRMAEWERKLSGRLAVEWSALHCQAACAGGTFSVLDDGSVLAVEVPDASTYVVTAEGLPEQITALRLEALVHPSLPHRGPGLADNGNFVLGEITLRLLMPADSGAGDEIAPPAFTQAAADHAQEKYPVAAAIDGRAETGWAINVAEGSLNVDRTAVFALAQPLSCPPGSRLEITLAHPQGRYMLGRFRISATCADAEVALLPQRLRQVLAQPPDERSPQDREYALSEFRKVDAERLPIAAKVDELHQRLAQLRAAMTTTLVMQERPQPRATHVHIRGDFLRPGARVQGAVPAVLPPLQTAGEQPTRLDLARWLVAPENPLTPRVIVNRVWQQYFGEGIVSTENDFGTQGSPPTHPEMLDWLARHFMAQGWSLKALHRLIVTSATYRQASAYRPDLAQVDPGNKLLGRQARLRLEAEVIRDACLSASGLLAPTIGGPGVYPPQPEGVYRFTQTSKYWTVSQGEDRYRRGMYIFFWRSSPYPFLITFDAPVGNVTCTRRVRSNTPLQALTLANDLAFFEFAQGLAARVLAAAPSPADDERLRYAFCLCLSRPPTAKELAVLSQYLARQREAFAAAPEAAARVAPGQLSEGVPVHEAAAWTCVARVLFNLDEFITRE